MSLTPKCCSVHTHCTFCDGKDTLEEMAAAAYAAGVKYFGTSCHSLTPLDIDEGYVLDEDMTEYKTAVARLREEYAGRMEILLGLEWDSHSPISPEGFDYWIGSVHSVKKRGWYACVDWDDEHLTTYCDGLFAGDYLSMAAAYFREVGRVAEMKPPILGHFDLITKLNRDSRFFREESLRYRKAALRALHRVDPAATVLEINTGAMAKGYRDTPYPALFLLKEWRTMGGRVIVTADAHTAGGILYGYDAAMQQARAAGFDHTVVLTQNGFVDCPL